LLTNQEAIVTKFLSATKRNPCQVCGGLTDCRTISESPVVLCKRERGDVPGFKFLGEASNPLWGKFLPVEVADKDREQWLRDRESQRERKQPAPAIVPAERLDSEYRRLQTKPLHDRHRDDLTRRGLTEEDIKTIAPFSVRGGYAVAFPDVDGLLCGAQTRLDKPDDGGKYKWFTPWKSWDKHNKFNEMPLAVWQPEGTATPGIAVLTEGTGAKPYLAAKRLGVTTIGAAGANWQPQTLTYTLQKLQAKEVWIPPDAGMLGNRNILGNYKKAQDLAESLGIAVRFLWWGQAEKEHGDIDELNGNEAIEYLTPEQFWALSTVPLPEIKRKNPLRWLTRLLKKKPVGFLPATPSAPQIYDLEYQKGDRLKVWEGITAKYILDRSGTGQGKSYDAGLIQGKITFITGEHRNPTTPTLAELHDLESRHAGLVEETTPDGGKRLRRAKFGQVPNTPANCSRSEQLNKLRSIVGSNADQASTICRSCPMYEACCHSEGYGFGYLHQRRVALGRDRFRAHPASLPSPKADGFDYSDRLNVWDEASANFVTHETIEFNQADIEKTVMALLQSQALSPDIQAVIDGLIAILNDRKGIGRYGLTHAEIVDKLPKNEVALDPIEVALDPQKFIEQALNPTAAYGINIQDLPASQRKFYATKSGDLQGIPKTWLVPLLKVLNGEYPGATITANHGGFTITLPNDRYREIAKAAKQNIFLDATLTREDLALKLGVSPEEIFVIREKPIATPNLKIYQVADMGKLTRDRGEDQKKRVSALLNHLDCPAIDWKAEEREGAHFVDSRGVNHFETVTRLAIVGTPTPNIGAMVSEFSAMAGRIAAIDDPDFQAWLHRKTESELIQEIGRVRANRRPGETIEVYLLTDHQFETITPIQKTSAEICPDAATKGDRFCNAMMEAAKSIVVAGDKLTQEGLAAVLEKSRGAVLKALNRLEMGWDDFKKMILLLLNSPIAEGSENSSVAVKLIETIAPYLEFNQKEEIFNFALGLPEPDFDLLEYLGSLLDSPPPTEPA